MAYGIQFYDTAGATSYDGSGYMYKFLGQVTVTVSSNQSSGSATLSGISDDGLTFTQVVGQLSGTAFTLQCCAAVGTNSVTVYSMYSGTFTVNVYRKRG